MTTVITRYEVDNAHYHLNITSYQINGNEIGLESFPHDTDVLPGEFVEIAVDDEEAFVARIGYVGGGIVILGTCSVANYYEQIQIEEHYYS